MHTWGKHTALDLRACDIDKITSEHNVKGFAYALSHAIDMIRYKDPQVVHFGDGNKSGFTLVQLISTSNICGHFCDDTGDAYIDIFSCKDYAIAEAIMVAVEFFNPKKMQYIQFLRDAESEDRQMISGVIRGPQDWDEPGTY